MKLRKKLIILSILFLFGFGVFFGTFAKGGYLVKADSLTSDYIYYGDVHSTETIGSERIEITIEAEYDANAAQYFVNITLHNLVYAFNTEDYFTTINALGYTHADTNSLNTIIGIETNYINPIDMAAHLNDDLNEGDYFYVYFMIDEEPDIDYLKIDIYLGDIYFEGISGVMFEYNATIYILSNEAYDRLYNINYNLGYEDGDDAGYLRGHEDGYDEGYALGETAGYNDGLDIGYYNGYETGHYDGYTEGEAYGYTNGLDEGYDIGLDEGLQLSGYKEAYEKGIAKAENTASTWFKGLFDGFQRFFNIQLGGISIGAIILIPLSITFAWFIIRQFRGGGGGD